MEDAGVCVEPWTAPPNSLNMPNPRIVTPDAPLVASMTWTWRKLAIATQRGGLGFVYEKTNATP
jgi:hypothetical protein